MSKTATKPDLLQACVHDLYAARTCAREALKPLIEAAGEELAARLEAIRASYVAECTAFEASGHDLSGPENLWMQGVMDDSRRDTRSIIEGPLLDTALIGAVRKGLAADFVSLQTGIAVAKALVRKSDAEMLGAMAQSSREHDDAMARLLGKIA